MFLMHQGTVRVVQNSQITNGDYQLTGEVDHLESTT